MEKENMVLNHLDNPHELERLYRKDPETFEQDFLSALRQNPDSPVLKVWYERLYFQETESDQNAFKFRKDFFVMLLFAVLAGVTTRILYHLVDQEMIHSVNLVFGIFPIMAAYFVYKHSHSLSKKALLILLSLFLIAVIYVNMLPIEPDDAEFLAYLHLPMFLWMLTGIAYTGDQYRVGSQRLAYLKFNGEFLILYVCIITSFVVLSVVTISLFAFLHLSIFDSYYVNVAIPGSVVLAILTTYLVVSDLKLAKNIAQYLAKIFSPLVLGTLLIYLGAIIWVEKNPFLDRDFLLTFNIILFIVLAITVFSISERGVSKQKNIFDYIQYALVWIAFIINSVALSAIIFRLSSYGISPNRIAILGANLLMWANIIGVIHSYTRFLQNKVEITAIRNTITKYLPIYGIWVAFVLFVFPLIFP